jgi:hypothetical protein
MNIVIFVVNVSGISFKMFENIKAKIASGTSVLYSKIPKSFGE